MQSQQEALELPDEVCNEAMKIFREATMEGLLEGRCLHTMFAGCLYVASQKTSMVISPAQFVRTAPNGVEENQMIRSAKYIKRQLSLSISPTSPNSLLEDYAEELDFSEDAIEEAENILSACTEENIVSGKSPRAVVAGCLYIAGVIHEGTSQKEVSNVIDVTEVTIRNRYKEQMEVAGIEQKVREAQGR